MACYWGLTGYWPNASLIYLVAGDFSAHLNPVFLCVTDMNLRTSFYYQIFLITSTTIIIISHYKESSQWWRRVKVAVWLWLALFVQVMAVRLTSSSFFSISWKTPWALKPSRPLPALVGAAITRALEGGTGCSVLYTVFTLHWRYCYYLNQLWFRARLCSGTSPGQLILKGQYCHTEWCNKLKGDIL